MRMDEKWLVSYSAISHPSLICLYFSLFAKGHQDKGCEQSLLNSFASNSSNGFLLQSFMTAINLSEFESVTIALAILYQCCDFLWPLLQLMPFTFYGFILLTFEFLSPGINKWQLEKNSLYFHCHELIKLLQNLNLIITCLITQSTHTYTIAISLIIFSRKRHLSILNLNILHKTNQKSIIHAVENCQSQPIDI